MVLGFTLLFLIVHCYVAWAAGRLAAPLPRIGRIALGSVVVLAPLALLVAVDASHFDGGCYEDQDAGGSHVSFPCELSQFLLTQASRSFPYLALPMLIWLGFYASSLAHARAEAEAR